MRAAVLRRLPDERLARLAAVGDEAAFAVIYARHFEALHAYARSLVRSDHDADDATQNALLKAYAAIARKHPDAPLRPWLFRITHNEAVTLLRSRKRGQTNREARRSSHASSRWPCARVILTGAWSDPRSTPFSACST